MATWVALGTGERLFLWLPPRGGGGTDPEAPVAPEDGWGPQDVDLEAALFNVGMDWNGAGLDTCFFDEAFPADGAAPPASARLLPKPRAPPGVDLRERL